jgi:hypothetical protein
MSEIPAESKRRFPKNIGTWALKCLEERLSGRMQSCTSRRRDSSWCLTQKKAKEVYNAQIASITNFVETMREKMDALDGTSLSH